MTGVPESGGPTVTALATLRTRSSSRGLIGRLRRASAISIDAARLAGLAVGLGPVASGWSLLATEWLRPGQALDANRDLPA